MCVERVGGDGDDCGGLIGRCGIEGWSAGDAIPFGSDGGGDGLLSWPGEGRGGVPLGLGFAPSFGLNSGGVLEGALGGGGG